MHLCAYPPQTLFFTMFKNFFHIPPLKLKVIFSCRIQTQITQKIREEIWKTLGLQFCVLSLEINHCSYWDLFPPSFYALIHNTLGNSSPSGPHPSSPSPPHQGLLWPSPWAQVLFSLLINIVHYFLWICLFAVFPTCFLVFLFPLSLLIVQHSTWNTWWIIIMFVNF